MVLIKADKNGVVDSVHYMPFDEKHGLNKTKTELEAEGWVLVSNIPEPENQKGKTNVLKYSRDKGLYYEYEGVKHETTEVERLEQRQRATEDVLLELLAKGMV